MRARLLMVVVALCFGCRHGNQAVSIEDRDKLGRASTGCRSDSDCWDAGPVCPAYCHYAFSVTNEASALFEVVDGARRKQSGGECVMDCAKQFYGIECRAGLCVERTVRPAASICTRAKDGLTDCVELVRWHRLQDQCHEFCGGALPYPTRVQFRIEGSAEMPNGDGYAIDYLTCDDCDHASRPP